MKPTAIDLFCGAGGATSGLQRAGFNVVLAVDRWSRAVEAHRRWHPNVPVIEADVAKVELCIIPPPWLVWASPSCKPWSTANRTPKRGKAHPEYFSLAGLVGQFVRSGARWLVIENVGGLIWSKEGKAEMGELYAACDRARLRAVHSLVNSNSVGVAQIRRRVFIVIGPEYVKIPQGCDYVPPESAAVVDASSPSRHYTGLVYGYSTKNRPTYAQAMMAQPSNEKGAQGAVGREDRRTERKRSKRGDLWRDTGPTARTLAECCELQQTPPVVVEGFTKRVAHELVGNCVPPPLAEHVARALLARDGERTRE